MVIRALAVATAARLPVCGVPAILGNSRVARAVIGVSGLNAEISAVLRTAGAVRCHPGITAMHITPVLRTVVHGPLLVMAVLFLTLPHGVAMAAVPLPGVGFPIVRSQQTQKAYKGNANNQNTLKPHFSASCVENWFYQGLFKPCRNKSGFIPKLFITLWRLKYYEPHYEFFVKKKGIRAAFEVGTQRAKDALPHVGGDAGGSVKVDRLVRLACRRFGVLDCQPEIRFGVLWVCRVDKQKNQDGEYNRQDPEHVHATTPYGGIKNRSKVPHYLNATTNQQGCQAILTI